MSNEDRDRLVKILGGVFALALYKQMAPKMTKQLRTIKKKVELEKIQNQRRAYAEYLKGEDELDPGEVMTKLYYDAKFVQIVKDWK